jgi:hypothetical protein
LPIILDATRRVRSASILSVHRVRDFARLATTMAYSILHLAALCSGASSWPGPTPDGSLMQRSSKHCRASGAVSSMRSLLGCTMRDRERRGTFRERYNVLRSKNGPHVRRQNGQRVLQEQELLANDGAITESAKIIFALVASPYYSSTKHRLQLQQTASLPCQTPAALNGRSDGKQTPAPLPRI